MNILLNHRQAGESATSYRHRRREVAKLVEQALKGKPATESNVKYVTNPDPDKGRITVAPRKYIPGPHKTHKPHDISADVMVLSQHGVPETKKFTVRHPGTLVKAVVQ